MLADFDAQAADDVQTDGNPTGILRDAAQGLVDAVIPAPNYHQIEAAVQAAEKDAAGQGVTSPQDMSAGPERQFSFQEERAPGEKASARGRVGVQSDEKMGCRPQ